jgi:hypothetical protein
MTPVAKRPKLAFANHATLFFSCRIERIMCGRLVRLAAILTLLAVIGMFASPAFELPRTAMRADQLAKAVFATLSSAAATVSFHSATNPGTFNSTAVPSDPFGLSVLDTVSALRC